MVSLVSQHISGRQKLGFADPVEPVDRIGVDRVGGWFAHPSVRTLDSGLAHHSGPSQLLSEVEGLPAPRDWATSNPHVQRGSDLVCRKGFSLMGARKCCPRR